MKLELGSGYHPTDGYVHLDANPNAPNVDIRAEAHLLPMIQDGAVDEILAVDVLEHLSYRQTDGALREWARVLRRGGRIYVQVPDAETIMLWFAREPTRLIDRCPEDLPRTALAGAAWRLLGGHVDGTYAQQGDDWKWNCHGALFSSGSLTKALEAAGLVIESIETNAHPNLCAWAVKP